ncbi:hypothetical protein GCK32_021737 [Trichostrongylus colubriformis]|uniref:Uncharacterized protein n=1 Tax=Trichostrongylus colubriformis TaxID=6319 RepID=A0AAN8FT18_TRICO
MTYNMHRYHCRYPDSMEPGSYYMECTGEPRGEDFTCSDKLKFRYQQSNSYIWDHRHYFTVRVYNYGKTGCDLLNLNESQASLDMEVTVL